MGARICCFVLALQIVSFVSATSRPFAPNHAVGVNHPGRSPQSSPQAPPSSKFGSPLMESQQGTESMEEVNNEEAYSKGISKIGSSPPSCEHKCFGCTPCEAIQVPTTSKRHSHLGVNYANYEPEGWKCKCGPSFYSP